MKNTPKRPIKGGPVSGKHSRWPLILIGVGKLCKTAALVFVSFVARYLLNKDTHEALKDALNQVRLDASSKHLHWVLEKALAIDPRQLKMLEVGTVVYAALFLVEGVGLILDFAWAEWLLVVSTGLLIPVEVWEWCERPTWLTSLVFVVNVAVMVYVCYRLKWRQQDKRLRELEEAKERTGEAAAVAKAAEVAKVAPGGLVAKVAPAAGVRDAASGGAG